MNAERRRTVARMIALASEDVAQEAEASDRETFIDYALQFGAPFRVTRDEIEQVLPMTIEDVARGDAW